MSVRDATPLDRGLIDGAMPFLRVALGLICIVYSAQSTVFIGATDIWYFTGDRQTLPLFADRYWYAVLLALVLFVGEVATGERSGYAYMVFFLPDVLYTARGLHVGLTEIIYALLIGQRITQEAQENASIIVGWLVAVLIGSVIAYYGEVLIFGKRRKKGPDAQKAAPRIVQKRGSA